jgi:hypothetical protein
MLLPPAEGDQALFNSACDRWRLYAAVLRVIETVLLTLFETMRSGPEDWRKHPAWGLFEQVKILQCRLSSMLTSAVESADL